MPHATQFRPRYPRIGAAGSAFVVTFVALLGGVGVLPTGAPAAGRSILKTSRTNKGAQAYRDVATGLLKRA